MLSQSTCSVDGCEREHLARGWCRMHYKRWTKHGDPSITERIYGLSEEDRFWPKVDKQPCGCWIWIASLNPCGYGQFSIGRRVLRAHRISYEWANGPIPAGLELDHLCRNRACVNPDHLEAVTGQLNTLRGWHARRSE